MAIKLDIFLKRTGQSIESWLDSNDVTRPEDFSSRCAFIGLTPSAQDVVIVASIFKRRKEEAEAKKEAAESVPSDDAIDVVDAVDAVDAVEPARVVEPKVRRRRDTGSHVDTKDPSKQ